MDNRFTPNNPQDSKPLILIKHSQPLIKHDIPANQWYLFETGRLRCIKLAERLASYKPEVIVSSTEPKSIETAQIIASHFKLSNMIADELYEHKRETVPYTNREHFNAEISRFFDQPDRQVFGEETADQIYLRFSSAISKLIEQNTSQSLFIVAHGTVISLWVSRKIGISPYPFWKSLGLPSFVVITKPVHRLVSVVEIN
jgi:broad specificity phosphatase PhoE